jgi:hypothetical protein
VALGEGELASNQAGIDFYLEEDVHRCARICQDVSMWKAMMIWSTEPMACPEDGEKP